MPGDWTDDLINDIKSGAADADLLKKYPQLKNSQESLESFRSYRYYQEKNKVPKEKALEAYPELQDFFKPKVLTPKVDIPKEDYTKPITQQVRKETPLAAEVAPKFTAEKGLQRQAEERELHKRYDPMVQKTMSDLNDPKTRSQYITNNRPKDLDPYPEKKDIFYESLNMDKVDEYLKKNFEDPQDRYYVRNKVKQQFEAQKDLYDINENVKKSMMNIPGVQEAASKIDLTDRTLPEDERMHRIVVAASQKDPDLENKITQLYEDKVKSHAEAKNEMTRAVMDNSAFGYNLPQTAPFHDQLTGASKALQGFFKFSGQTGQMASDLLELIPAKGAQEAAYSTRNTGEDFIEKNKFPEGGNLGDVLSGELEPMALQGVAFSKLAHFAGAPALKLLAGAADEGMLSRFASGALGGMATAPINSMIIAKDFYHNQVKQGELPEIAQSQAEDVFNKNIITDLAISPLQFGLMNIPTSKFAGKLLTGGLSSTVSGAHLMLQDYYAQAQNNPTLKLWDYMLSEQGIKTGLLGAGMGIMQNLAISKMNDWKTDRMTRNQFTYNRKYSEFTDLPGNNAIAADVLKAIEMKNTPGRADELKNLVDEFRQSGTYKQGEADKIKSIIDDVEAVRGEVPKLGNVHQRLAIFNELLNKKSFEDLSEGEVAASHFKEMAKESDARITRILNNEEPLYFINGNETGKDQLLHTLEKNPELFDSPALRIKVSNDSETKNKIAEMKSDYDASKSPKVEVKPEERKPLEAITENPIENKNSETKAVKEQSTTAVPIRPAPGNSAVVGGGNEGQGPVNKDAAGEKGPEEVAQRARYENGIASVPSYQAGRLQPEPIFDNQPKQLRLIIKDVSKALKQRVIYAKPGRTRAIGSYMPGSKGIKIRFNGDLDTTAHELGHSLDDQFDLYTEIAKNPAAISEIEEFSKHGGSKPLENHPNPTKYIQQEGFAEWLRGLVIAPEQAKTAAPETYKIYQEKVHEAARKAIEDFSTDVRTFAGATGRDMTLANVEMEPEKMPGILKQIFSNNNTGNEFYINWSDRLAANYVNPLHAFDKAVKYAMGLKGLDEVLPMNDPILLSRIFRGFDGKMNEIIKNGMIDTRLNILTDAEGNPKNLDWLLKPLNNTDQGTITEDMKDVVAYMIAKRTAELSLRFDRDENISGTGGGIKSDVEVAVKTLNEFRTGDPARLARIEEAAKRYQEMADDIMRYAVDSGRMSEEQYQLIKDNNEHYVAMGRMLETEPDHEMEPYKHGGGNKLGQKTEITHKIKGSAKPITNPYFTLLDNMYKTIKESDRNNILQQFRNLIHEPRGMNEGEPTSYSDLGMIGKEGDKETIPIFVDGKLERWIFQKDIHAQLKGFDSDIFQLPGAWQALAIPGKILRFTTTQTPTFAARNWTKDTVDRMIKTTTGSGVKELFGDKADWDDIARAGGLNSGFYLKTKENYDNILKHAMRKMSMNKDFVLVDGQKLKDGWHWYENNLYKSETSNRVAEYRAAMKQAKEKGMDDYNSMIYGASKARGLIDFAMMGHHMKFINQIIPFTNAKIQGWRSTIINYRNNPGAFWARAFLYSVVPGVISWLYNHKDKETAKQYEEQPDYQRDMFMTYKIGDNRWLSIPKPYELSLPQAGIDRILSYTIGGNEKALQGYTGSVLNQVLPIDETNAGQPFQSVIEGMANYDFFRKNYIIPPREDVLNLALRHTGNASRLGQLVQQAAGIDARKIEHFITSQFSYMGKYAVKVGDFGSGNQRTEFDITDTGFFKASPAYNSKSVQEFLSTAKGFDLTRTQDYKTFDAMAKKYFNATTNAEKEKLGSKLIDFARIKNKEWEKLKVEEVQTERAEKKKAVGK